MPRTLAQNAQYIAETIKPAIKSAIEAQGVTVPSTDSFLDYADRIGEIEGGGSGYQLKDLPTGSIATVNDAAPLPLNALKVSVEAVQDLHGYDHPWVGGAGKNKFDGNYPNINGGVQYRAIYLGSGTFTMSTTCPETATTATNLFFLAGNVSSGASTSSNGVSRYVSRTVTAVDGYVTIAYRNSEGVNPQNYNTQLELGSTATSYEPYSNICPIHGWDSGEITVCDDIQSPTQTETITQQFPTTIYGAEWDVTDGELGLKITDGFVDDLSTLNWVKGGGYFYAGITNFKRPASVSTVFNGLCSACAIIPQNAPTDGTISGINWLDGVAYWTSLQTKQEVEQALSGSQLKYELANPTYITLTGLSIRLNEGTNNVYADCGDIIEGEYFVDEGAIDVRKVDYQIGSSGSIKTTDGRVLSGFASMSGYHARPLDASGNWLDVDWSKDFEIGIAFKLTSLPTYQFLFGCGLTTNDRFKQPRLFYDNSTQTVELNISTDGSSWESITLTNNSIVANKWYFVKIKFTLSTLKLIASISEDLSTFATMCDETLSGAVYHNSASLSIGGDTNNSAMTSNDCLIDTFNTYVKGDGVNWGAFTGAFPS